MTDSNSSSRATVARLTGASIVLLATTMLSACALDSREELSPAAPPEPGTISVARPLELAERARVPEKEVGFVSAQREDDRLTITHDGRLRMFTAGDVIGGAAGGGYLVRVTGARAIDAQHIALDTTPAALTELLVEGAFHVHYDATEHARRLGEFAAQQRSSGEEDGERIASDAEALRIAGAAPLRLLHLTRAQLPASCGIGGEGTADLDVTAELAPVLDLDVEVGPRGGLNPVPELKTFRLVTSGTLEVTAKLHSTGTVEGHCSIDLLALAGGALSLPLPSLTFWIGPVPVVVTTDVVPRAEANLALSLTASEATAEAHTTASLAVGVDYRDHAWTTVWEPACTSTGDASVQAPGPIAASCVVSAGAELRARLYGVLGPNLGVQAYARATADTAPPYCDYDARIDGGVRAYAQVEAGVSVGPLDLTLARLDLVNLELAHFDGPTTSGKLRDAPECSDEE